MRLLAWTVGLLLLANIAVMFLPPIQGGPPGSFNQVAAQLQATGANSPYLQPVSPPLSPSLKPGSGEDAEFFRAKLRGMARKTALDAFARPWSGFCTSEGRRQLASALNYYYEHRAKQERFYASATSDGMASSASKWTADEDRRIETMTRETYRRSNFRLQDLTSRAAKAVDPIVRHERPVGPDCSERPVLGSPATDFESFRG
jgi:hypothetical protein